MRSARAIFGIVLAASAAACGVGGEGSAVVSVAPPTAEVAQTPGVSLRIESVRARRVVVSAVLGAPKGGAARVMELWLKHSPDLELVEATRGDALEAAGKELVAQSKGDDVVRAVAYSGSNVSTIGSGTLVTYTFAAKGDGLFRIELATEKPMFAPPSANDGLHVSEPLDVLVPGGSKT